MSKATEKKQRNTEAQMLRGLDFIHKYGSAVKGVSMLPERISADERKEMLNRLNERFKSLPRSMFENERPRDD